jgi:hypothetical protein
VVIRARNAAEISAAGKMGYGTKEVGDLVAAVI